MYCTGVPFVVPVTVVVHTFWRRCIQKERGPDGPIRTHHKIQTLRSNSGIKIATKLKRLSSTMKNTNVTLRVIIQFILLVFLVWPSIATKGLSEGNGNSMTNLRGSTGHQQSTNTREEDAVSTQGAISTAFFTNLAFCGAPCFVSVQCAASRDGCTDCSIRGQCSKPRYSFCNLRCSVSEQCQLASDGCKTCGMNGLCT